MPRIPPSVATRIHTALVDAFAYPELRARFRSLGYEVLDPRSPTEFSSMIRKNIRKREQAVKGS